MFCVELGKRDKHVSTWKYHGMEFTPLGFSTLISFSLEVQGLLSCICQRLSFHVHYEARDWVLCRFYYTFIGGVAKQLVICLY